MSSGGAVLSKYRPPISIQVVALSGAVAGGQGLTALLTAKWLGAGDRGVLAVAQSVSMLLVLVGGLGLIQATRVLLAEKNSSLSLVTHGRISNWLLFLQLGLAGAVGAPAFADLTDVRNWWAPVCIAVMAVSGLRAALFREALHGIGWHRAAVVSELVAALLPLLIAAVAFYIGRLDLRVALVSFASSAAVQSILQARMIHRAKVRRRASATIDHQSTFRLFRSILRVCFPALLAALGMALATRMDRILLAYFSDNAAVGVYATAATLADLPWVLPVAVSPIIVRQVAQTRSLESHRFWWWRIMGATTLFGVAVFVSGVYLMDSFLGRDFHGHEILLAVLLCASLAVASLQVDLGACNGLGDLKSSAITAGWGAGVGLGAYIVLINFFGLMGCAYATVVTYFTMAVVARVRLRRQKRMRRRERPLLPESA